MWSPRQPSHLPIVWDLSFPLASRHQIEVTVEHFIYEESEGHCSMYLDTRVPECTCYKIVKPLVNDHPSFATVTTPNVVVF